MASSATIIGIRRSGERVEFLFSDGSGREYGSMEAVREDMADLDSDVDRTKRIAIGYWLARDANLSNISLVRDKAITFDMADNNAIKLDPNSTATGISAKAR